LAARLRRERQAARYFLIFPGTATSDERFGSLQRRQALPSEYFRLPAAEKEEATGIKGFCKYINTCMKTAFYESETPFAS